MANVGNHVLCATLVVDGHKSSVVIVQVNHRAITVLLLIVAGFCDASTRLSVGNFFKLKWHGNLVKLQGISQIDKKKKTASVIVLQLRF